MPPSFDQLDYQILNSLQEDARLSASQIARRLKANERTIRKRIDRLVALKAVRLAAVLNPEVFGYPTALDAFIHIDPDHEAQAVAALLAMPEIAYLSQGTHEVSIQARFKDPAAAHAFLRHTLPGLPGVRLTGYSLVPHILRNIDAWMPPAGDFPSSPE